MVWNNWHCPWLSRPNLRSICPLVLSVWNAKVVSLLAISVLWRSASICSRPLNFIMYTTVTGSISRTCPGFVVYVCCLSHVVCAGRVSHAVDTVGVVSCVDVCMCAVIWEQSYENLMCIEKLNSLVNFELFVTLILSRRREMNRLYRLHHIRNFELTN